MIDMNIPMIGLILRSDMTDEYDYSEPKLPEGFHFEHYKGDEEGKLRWSEIMSSVGFSRKSEDYLKEGVAQFNKEFGDDIELAKERVFFVVTDDGKYVGSCAAWQHLEIREGRGQVHWLAVLPEYQRYGLGKALFKKCLSVFKEKLPGLPVYLNTQTTSHRALCLYIKNGFFPIYWTEKTKEDYEKSVEVLKGVMREAEYVKFASYARDESMLDKEWEEKQRALKN